MDKLCRFASPGQESWIFVGRDEELREIASFIKGNQSVSIVGPQGIGKTALMQHLMRSETAGNLGVEGNLLAYLDCSIFASCQQHAILAGLCAAVALALHDKGSEPEPALTTCAVTPTWMAFESAVRKLNRRGLRVVLLLDDFEQISGNSNVDVRFYNGMRSVAGRLKMSLLTSSERPLIELTCFQSSREVLSSPFFNIFSQLFLGLLPESDARCLIRRMMGAAGKEISADMENFIFLLVGGHPLALQVACSYASDQPDDQDKIELQTRQELDGYFRRDWNDLSKDERDMLLHLSEICGEDTGKPEIRSALRDLARKCMVVKSGGLYKYPSKAWAEFVKSQ